MGNKQEYKMWDLIAMTARRHERTADDIINRNSKSGKNEFEIIINPYV